MIARGARRHKLPSEASRRFERTVDPQLPPVAAERAAQLLVEHGGGTVAAGRTDEGAAPAAAPVRMPLDLPDRVAGVTYRAGATVRRLSQIGCAVELGTGDDGRGEVARHAAVLAAGPGAARRPGRGGAAAGGLRHHPVGAAGRAGRARA